jgi:hypothetical protein
MLNYWWVTRPKRKLNSVPEVLAEVVEVSLNKQWQGERKTHITLEESLEAKGLKRPGTRRDQGGGGGRTYTAWLKSLGLVFMEESTRQLKLTLAGEAIMAGESPVKVLKSQVLKYQFPSAFSVSRGVNVNRRFKVHPFRFLLMLMQDSRIGYLTTEEIGKIVIEEGEDEKCVEPVIKHILEFRDVGDGCLASDFFVRYGSNRKEHNAKNPFQYLTDIANTMMNWLEYTQLVVRGEGKISISPDKEKEVREYLNVSEIFIERPEQQEYFQRKYGLDSKHQKDTRNLTESQTVTANIIANNQIRKWYLGLAASYPITGITSNTISYVSDNTGLAEQYVEDVLHKEYPHGSIGAFLSNYYEMAFKGRDEATEFEKATAILFHEVFGFETTHVGPIGLTPDVLLNANEYQAIIDNKAYSSYTISNDHRNRMIHNYIEDIDHYGKQGKPLAFFTYIAGGFGKNINNQIESIYKDTGVCGSAVSVANIILMVEVANNNKLDFNSIRKIFSVNRQLLQKDVTGKQY